MQQAAETALQRGLRRWDRRRGFRRPSRNLVAEGIDPGAYKDPSWSSDPSTTDKLYTAVVMEVSRAGVTTRVGKDSIVLPATAFKWTERTTMEGVLKRGDIVYVRLSEDSKTKARTWVLDQLPVVQGRW